jgi:hypothetical protein
MGGFKMGKENIMTVEHVNKYGMFKVVIKVLGNFASVFAGMPALVRAVAAFTQIVQNIAKVSGDVSTGTAPKTNAKNQSEAAMADGVVALVGKLHSYAAENEDVELMDESDVTGSDFTRTRNSQRAELATKLVNLVESHKGDLTADYPAIDKEISDTRRLIADFDSSLGDRDSTKKGQTSGRMSVEDMFHKADFILDHQIGKQMESFKKTNPDFYNAYNAALVIVDVAAHHKGKGGNGGTTDSGTPPPEK